MAYQYFLYNTELNNTIVDKSDVSFSPHPPYEEIYIDYYIPESQPLYFYANSGGTGGTIIVNTEENIDAYIKSIKQTLPNSNVTYGDITGYTATTGLQQITSINWSKNIYR